MIAMAVACDAAGAHRRRADHRARRHRPGRHPRRAARPARPARHRGPPDHPRPRRGRRHRRPGVVMYAGRAVEQAPATELFARPRHPYTRGLLRRCRGRGPATTSAAAAGDPRPGADAVRATGRVHVRRAARAPTDAAARAGRRCEAAAARAPRSPASTPATTEDAPMSEPVLEVVGPGQALPAGARAGRARGRRRVAVASGRARCSAWSASPAAASRRSAGASCG